MPGPACPGMLRSRIERSCDLLVRALGRDREVPCAFLRIDVERRKSFVHSATSVQGHRLVAGGSEKGMRESNPVAVELEQAPSLRELDVIDDGASQRLQHGHRRRSKRGDSDERFPHATGQRTQALRYDGPQAFGQRQVDAVDTDGAVRQSTSQLEREEGVTAGGPVHADENRSGQCEPEPTPQEPVDCADREWLDGKPAETGEAAVERERNLDLAPPHRRKNGDRFGLQPAQREREDIRGARVEPLNIVDRDEERALLSQRSHDRKECEPENADVGRRPF